MLSPNAKEIVPTQNIAERGKRRAKEQENNNSEPFSLLTEMREEMKRRDEHNKEELRWRDENLAVKTKKEKKAWQHFSNRGMRSGEKS